MEVPGVYLLCSIAFFHSKSSFHHLCKMPFLKDDCVILYIVHNRVKLIHYYSFNIIYIIIHSI